MDEKKLGAIRTGETVAIIPARAGSKGVKNKNIRCLQGYPLLAYSIASAKLCPYISRVIVSTDSVQYAKIAEYYGAEAPFLRPEKIAMDNSTDIEFMKHAINWLYEHEGAIPEFFVHLRPTYPLREVEVLNGAIISLKKDLTATSLRSAHLASNTPYKWFNLRNDGYYKSILENLTLDEANNPRQEFPDVYIPDGYVDLLRTSFIIKNGLIHGERMIGYVVPEGIDIDAMKDLEYLEYYMMKHESDIKEYLSKNYKKLDEINL